jgi:cephalosporin hydroxylase
VSERRASILDALENGRADESLRAIDAMLADCPYDVEMLIWRVNALIAVGQYELARDAARIVLRLQPDNASVAQQLAVVQSTLAAPPIGSCDPLARSYSSGLPTAMLQRLQMALHHQNYKGVQIVKSPFDLMVYQQIVFRVRPRTIIEIGSKAGGSGLFFGDLLRNFDIDGRVLSFDIVPVTGVSHPLVTYAYGNGRHLGDVLDRETWARLSHPLFVVEDADHSVVTTSAVLEFFHHHLQPGDWLVVEDGNLSSIVPETYPDYSSGPHLALQEFFRVHAADYRVAAEFCDMYAYNATTSSNGILERIHNAP